MLDSDFASANKTACFNTHTQAITFQNSINYIYVTTN
jgi:hypothetical protein